MYAWNLQVACILTLYTHIYIYICIHMCILHSNYRWDFGIDTSRLQSLSLHTFICVYMYILQSDYRLVVLWERRFAGILFVHVHVYLYLYIIYMHVLFWLKLKEVDRRTRTIPVSFIHATQAEAVGLAARTSGAA